VLAQTLGEKAKQLLFLRRRQRIRRSLNVGEALHDEEDSKEQSWRKQANGWRAYQGQ
jgi:hypothetical protein